MCWQTSPCKRSLRRIKSTGTALWSCGIVVMVRLKFRDIHNICSSMRLNWPKWGFKPWVFWYTMIIQTNPYFQILPNTKGVLLSLSGQWWRHHPKHGDESIGWASNHQTHQPLMDRVDKEQGSFVALSLLFWWNPILPRTDIIKQHVTR